jgi:hypothetical protein
MPDFTAERRLVKSPPELWAELSELERLARHLGAFGEIRITKLEPESTVAWEGEHASGTVSIEPSGWGTKVTLKAVLPEPPAPEPEPEPEQPTVESAALEPPPPEPAVPSTPEGEALESLFRAADKPSEPDPRPVPDTPRRGFFSRWMSSRWTRRGVVLPTAETDPLPAEPEPLPPEPEPQPVEPEPEPQPVEPEPTLPTAEPTPAAEPDPDPPAPGLDPDAAEAALNGMLDTLGAAHHRPFSRG